MDSVLTISCFTAASSLIAAVASVVGALRRKKIESLQLQIDKEKAKVFSLKKELYCVYLNVLELLEIEDELSRELDISKRTTRKGRNTDRYIQPKRVSQRMCSTDGGHSWHPSQVMTSEREHDRINDLQQYGNRLVIYSESGVYEVSKAELVAKSTTGIRSVASDQKESPIYDLQGRKVVEPHHGIYIKNGRIILK